MAWASKPKSSGTKVREHRERLRRQGLAPYRFGFRTCVRRPSVRKRIASHWRSRQAAHASEDQAFIDAVSDWVDE
jgi:hypothetical protein